MPRSHWNSPPLQTVIVFVVLVLSSLRRAMEVSGVVFRPLPCFSGAGFDAQSSSNLSFSSEKLRLLSHGDSKVCVRSRKNSSLGFAANGHLQYYVSPKAGGKIEKEKKKMKNSETVSLKKKLKLIKGMTKDLLKFSSMGFGVGVEEGLIGEVKEKKISEATEILLSQLKQLKAEEKELKRRNKEEKAKLRAMVASESLSIDLSSLTSNSIAEPQIEFEVLSTSTLQGGLDRTAETSTSYSNGTSVMVGGGEKIEVCMGGKCKKSGASTLLEEFQQRVGVEGAVVGCKCMGKCRDGPNVRIVNTCNGGDDFVKPITNPLCIGVGLEDVGVIVSNFFGEERKDLGLVVA